MRILFPLFLLAGCASQPQYVTRTVTECSWAPRLTASATDTLATKREIIAYETARQINCPLPKE